MILINATIRYNNILISKKNIKDETFNKEMFENEKYISSNKTYLIKKIDLNKIKITKNFRSKIITSFYRPNLKNRFKHE
jgi:hypothetical protein